jgi:CRISPR-associated protein Cas1
MDPDAHLTVVRRMYMRRFPDMDCAQLSLKQIRGLEGIRVREAYRRLARQYGVAWKVRNYKQDDWDKADPINKAISTANTVLYSLCQAAIVSLGYSAGLGFVHTGKLLSFVYDIADLYKVDTTLPAAFSTIGGGYADLDKDVRTACRKTIKNERILRRIPEDIAWIFDCDNISEQDMMETVGDIWGEGGDTIAGGVNYAGEAET